MGRALVAAHYVWDEYPGLRVGRLVAGRGDLGRHPRGDTHAISTEDATRTACGLPRSSFPHTFDPAVRLSDADPCAACDVAVVAAGPELIKDLWSS